MRDDLSWVTNRKGRVIVYLRTPKIDGLTESDFYMAAKIDRAFSSFQASTAPDGAHA